MVLAELRLSDDRPYAPGDVLAELAEVVDAARDPDRWDAHLAAREQ